MTRGRKQEVLAAVAAYQRATRHLREHLQDVDAGLDTVTALIKQDEFVTSLLEGTGAATRRREFAEAMRRFDESRRRLRVALLRLGIEHGEGVAEIAGAIGISRQLAYRILAEEP